MKRLSDEQFRILKAAADGRLKLNEHFSYIIEGEARPDRREREKLQKRGLLSRPCPGEPIFTEKGLDALKHYAVGDPPPPPPQPTSLFDQAGRAELEGDGGE